MSLPQAEFQIPQTEYTASQPDIIEASPLDDVPQYYDSLVRGSEYYEKRVELLGKEAEERNERLTIVALGNNIHNLRQAEVEKRLGTPKASVMKRVLNLIMTGPLDSFVDKSRLVDETFRALMNEESTIGSSLIEVPPTVSRQEFFLSPSHPNEWYYHAQSLLHPEVSITIRYMVLESASGTSGVVKSINGGSYEIITSEELKRFTILTKNYSDQVSGKDLYELAA